MSRGGHRLLVVEDDPDTSALICQVLRSRGDSPRAAATVEEALAAMAEEEFCGFVLDQQLPLDQHDRKPLATGGERVTIAAREQDLRRVGKAYVTPIVALTGYSHASAFVASLFKEGISAFVEKPLSDNLDLFSRELRDALASAGRDDHTKCAALTRRPSTVLGPGIGAKIAALIGAANWEQVRLSVVDGHTLRIQGPRATIRRTYTDLGFADGRGRAPTKKWDILMAVCVGHGTFRWKTFGDFRPVSQAMSTIRATLCEAFGLEDDPFREFKPATGWVAKFFATSDVSEHD